MYVHELANWPHFSWNQENLAEILIQLRHQQGRLIGSMESIGFPTRDEAILRTLTQDVVKSSEIEGEILDQTQVRSSVLFKDHYWKKIAEIPLNERQRKIIHRLLDGFNGNLTSSKWAKITKCSQDTAYRDILELIERGILKKNLEGGRSTSYSLVP